MNNRHDKYTTKTLITRLSKEDLKRIGNELKYYEALRLFSMKDFEKAVTMFQMLNDFEDSIMYLKICQKQLNVVSYDEQYIKATNLYLSGQYEEAIKIYKTMLTYKQSKMMLELCENEINNQKVANTKTLSQAKALMKEKKYYEAAVIYEQNLNEAKGNDLYALAYDLQYQAKDYVNAMKWYRIADQKGEVNSANQIGILYELGLGVSKDIKEAMKWYHKGALNNVGVSNYNLGLKYQYNEKNYQEAMKYYLKADELGYKKACNYIGELYAKGLGVTKNKIEAKNWYLKAAKENIDVACYNLAHAHYLDKEYEQAFKWFKKADSLNYKGAANYIGLIYAQGLGVEKNREEAKKWYLKDAKKDLPVACYNLAYNHYLDKNYTQALEWFKKADKLNYKGAANYIGLMYALGYGVSKNIPEAMKWYLKDAQRDLPVACYNLAYNHYNKKEYSQALKWFKKAYELNHVKDTCYYLGLMYEFGYGVDKNKDEALKWYLKSAQLNHGKACYRVGYKYYYDTNYSEAMKWLIKACDHGETKDAANYIGLMYDWGYGVSVNKQEALDWYLKAAKLNNSYACYNVGLRYYYDQKNYPEAMAWFKKADSLGYSKEASNYIGLMYDWGYGVNANKQEALNWYLKGAKLNNSQACYNAGLRYYYDHKNYAEALKWFIQADNLGYSKDSCNYIATIYDEGLSGTKDYSLAQKYYLKAAKLDNPKACYSYAWNLHNVDYNYYEAMKWFKKADELGVKKAANEIGILYDRGLGVSKNTKEAIKWYLKAANNDIPVSCYNLGIKYQYDEKNYKLAESWYLKAINKKYDNARYQLAKLYLYDIKDYAKGFAQANDAYKVLKSDESQILLGLCYKNGWGCSKDKAYAKQLIKPLADKGNKEAKNAMSGLGLFGF